MNKGWISLHRKFLNWEWYKDINVKSLFIHCLLNANFEDKSWRGIIIKRGDFFTSINHLSFDLNLTIKQIRTALKKLEKTNEISIKGASNGTMVTICKYDDYQEIEKQKGKQRASKGQAKGKQRATTNNYNKDNNVNKVINIEFNTFWNLYNKKVGSKEKLIGKWDKLTDQERENIINYLPSYILSTSEKKFRKNPETFLNNKSWNDEIIKEETPGRKKTSIDFDQKQTTDSEYDNDPFLPPLNKTE